MTPEQIKLVQQSFARVAPDAEEASQVFYTRLFEQAPEVRPLFKGDIRDQGKKLMAMLATVVQGLNDLDALMPAIRALAVRHNDYKVEPAHYDHVGAALLWTFEQALGDAFTTETRDAWSEAYGVLAGAMIAASAEAR